MGIFSSFGVIILVAYTNPYTFEIDIANQTFGFEKVSVNLTKIVPEAIQAMKKFFEGNKTKYAHEKEHSGVDALKSPLAYFKQELKEHAHKNIRDAVDKTGILTLALYNQWENEEEKEKD